MEALRCDFCNGSLVIDDSREFAVCEFCGTKYTKTTLQAKIQENGIVEIVPGEKNKEKLKQDIQTFVRLKNYLKAIKLMNEFTDTYPNDPDGYKIKLDFICTEGCSPFLELEECRYKGDDSFTRKTYQFAHRKVFEAFKKNIDILKKLESIDYTKKYALRFLNLIKSASTPFHFGLWSCGDNFNVYNPNYSDGYRKDKERIQNLIKSVLVDTLGTEIGTLAFNEGVYKANEYKSVMAFDTQVIKYHRQTNYKDCIFLLGNQILILESYGKDDDFYRFSFFTMSNIPDIDILKETMHHEENKRQYRENKLCQHCGGKFRGVFKKVCSKCGKPKDY